MSVEELLLTTASRRELHHAVILHGPSRDRLMSVAAATAARLICESGSAADGCVSCTKLARGSHPDLHLVSPAGERKSISAEQVREVVTGASLRPYEGRSKVYIIEPADAMTVQAANALLKTLEEPVADTSFLLVTRSSDLLLPTIRSRSQSLFIGSAEDSVATDLEPGIRAAIAAYAEKGEVAVLLGLAAALMEHEPKDALAAIAAVLRTLTAERSPQADAIRNAVSISSLLAGADAAIKWVPRLVVNVDSRLVLEQTLLRLVRRDV